MHYPTSRKIDDKKTIRRANIEDRKDLIKDLGRKEFYSNPMYKDLWDYPCPPCFLFIFSTFLELYSHCTTIGGFAVQKNITWQDIESFCHVRKIELSLIEVDYLFKIAHIADDEIAELEKGEN